MSREITFVHLTDLHIGDHVTDDHLFSDTQETLREILALVATIEPKPSFLVASGDLSNRGDAESYEILKGIMESIDLPVVYALGNHDTREGFYRGMLGRADNLDAPYFHDRVIDGVHVVALDSSTPGFIGGSLRPSSSSSAALASLPSSYTARKPGSTTVVPEARKALSPPQASSTLTVLSVAGTIWLATVRFQTSS